MQGYKNLTSEQFKHLFETEMFAMHIHSDLEDRGDIYRIIAARTNFDDGGLDVTLDHPVYSMYAVNHYPPSTLFNKDPETNLWSTHE